MVGLLTFTALAVDIGQRNQALAQAQHAIDAATIAGAQYLANHDQDYDGASSRIKEIMRQDLGLDAATAWNNCEDPNPLAQIASIDTAISNECISFKRTQAQPTDQPTNDIRVVLPDLTMPTIFGGITGNDHLDLSAIAASNGNNCADPFDPTCGGAGGSTTTGPTTTAGPTTTLSEADFCHWTDVWWLLMTDEGWTRCGVYHPEINITTWRTQYCIGGSSVDFTYNGGPQTWVSEPLNTYWWYWASLCSKYVGASYRTNWLNQVCQDGSTASLVWYDYSLWLECRTRVPGIEDWTQHFSTTTTTPPWTGSTSSTPTTTAPPPSSTPTSIDLSG